MQASWVASLQTFQEHLTKVYGIGVGAGSSQIGKMMMRSTIDISWSTVLPPKIPLLLSALATINAATALSSPISTEATVDESGD